MSLKKDKKGKDKESEIICFECKEPGYLRSECPKLKKNSKKKAPKKKAMMATWKDLDKEQEGTKSQEKEEIVTNLCFMADIVFEEETKVLDYELNSHIMIFRKHMMNFWMTLKHLLFTMLL